MANSNSLQFYLTRADEARKQAEAATLSHVRDRCRRSAAAWAQLAQRSAAIEAIRLKQMQMAAKVAEE